ncbi:MAG: DUF1311 domain-containing protein [Bdellovibrionaceae bacterium]|nr:DUF1311 domain-containing protein [Pseudobdellovibrionaceae bacterium]
MLLRKLVFFFVFLSLFQAHAGIPLDCTLANMEIVPLVICIDDEVRELDQIKERIQARIFLRIEYKYAKNDPKRAKILKAKIETSIKIWEAYRSSYCDMESVYLENDSSRGEFIKQCLVTITKMRIEDLRLLQINI